MSLKIFLNVALLTATSLFARGEMFLEQKPAREYWTVSCATDEEFICAAALQGLVARAVNEGQLDELLAIEPRSPKEQEWIERTEKRTRMHFRGKLSLVEAACRYKQLIRGTVLYSADQSKGDSYQLREDMDLSANAATVMSGLLNALPVSETLSPILEQKGFAPVFDARKTSLADILRKEGRNLNDHMLCSLDPQTGNVRDLAVAHRTAICFGNEEMAAVMERMSAPFLVLGWGVGDEFEHVAPTSRQGGIQTVSNWTRNLSFLSAGASIYQPQKIRSFDPAKINWDDKRRTISFMLSDGDNTGWVMNSFWKAPYYGSKRTGSFPMGFSVAMAQLCRMAPVVMDHLAETQPENVSLVEFSGGYFYPDLFAEEQSNRNEILRNYARDLNNQMKKSGARLLCFIVRDSSSRQAADAYQIFAEELEPLDGMLVMDYAPYHKGEGTVYWAKNRNGIDIPAVTARFCMWENMNRPNAGSPRQIAGFVEKDSEPNSWTAVHAWSQHGDRKLKGTDAVADCVDILPKDIHVVTPEEMIWRIRMEHHPKQTLDILENRKSYLSLILLLSRPE